MISNPSSSQFYSQASYTQAYRAQYADLHIGLDVRNTLLLQLATAQYFSFFICLNVHALKMDFEGCILERFCVSI